MKVSRSHFGTSFSVEYSCPPYTAYPSDMSKRKFMSNDDLADLAARENKGSVARDVLLVDTVMRRAPDCIPKILRCLGHHKYDLTPPDENDAWAPDSSGLRSRRSVAQ